MSDQEYDYENMSDEELEKLSSPSGGSKMEEPEENNFLEDDVPNPSGTLEGDLDRKFEEASASEEEDDHTTPPQTDGDEDGSEAEAEDEPDDSGQPPQEASSDEEGEDDGDAGDPDEDPEKAKADQDPDPDNKPNEAADEAIDYESQIKQIMAPFKANGREITPQSPEEVVRLMQQGANYVKKMTALKPNLKMMRMLQNNDLLDENKLNFLIDLNRRDPEAIKKLIHDAKIDPLEIDTEDQPKYRPSNNAVSDDEYEFYDTLEDVKSSETGNETLGIIKSKWDDASKEAVFKEPAILRVIDEQRANGIYDRISAEIERQQALGNLTNTPFLQAYRQVGDQLHAEGKLVPEQANAPAPAPQNRKPVESRPAARKPKPQTDERVKAASPSRSTPKPSSQKKEFDVFALSDEEINAMTSLKV